MSRPLENLANNRCRLLIDLDLACSVPAGRHMAVRASARGRLLFANSSILFLMRRAISLRLFSFMLSLRFSIIGSFSRRMSSAWVASTD